MARIRPKPSVIAREVLKYSTLKRAAEMNDWDKDALSEWVRTRPVQKLLNKAAESAFEHTIHKLLHSSGLALTQLTSLMMSPDSPPAIKLNAAKVLLEMSFRASESQLMRSRLETIEAELARLEPQHDPQLEQIAGFN